jgi:hypothetical protein
MTSDECQLIVKDVSFSWKNLALSQYLIKYNFH